MRAIETSPLSLSFLAATDAASASRFSFSLVPCVLTPARRTQVASLGRRGDHRPDNGAPLRGTPVAWLSKVDTRYVETLVFSFPQEACIGTRYNSRVEALLENHPNTIATAWRLTLEKRSKIRNGHDI